MKKMILMSLVTLTAVMSHAAGRQEASEICKSFTFDSDRNQCIAEIGKHNYYEQNAINVCKTFTFDSDKQACVKAISDKSYEAYETDNCARSTFDSDKLKCLNDNGRPVTQTPPPPPPPPGYPGCLSKFDVISQLQNIDRQVYFNRNNDARINIADLINRLQRCP